MTNSTKPLLTPQKWRASNQVLEAAKAQRLKSSKLESYRPYRKQQEFHLYGESCKQRLLRAGNQQGKTYCGAMEMAMHLTGQYPDWWEGRKFLHPIDAWAASDTGETTRDNPQRALLGPPGEWGTGAIPHAALIEAKRGQQVADLADTVQVQHASGGISTLGFKRYDQGRQAWQGPSKHVVWCDEEPPEHIYDEALARLIATRGMIYTTFTPLLGMSSIVKRLIEGHDGINCADVNMTIADALHISRDEWQSIMSSFPEHERDARISGIPVLGSGRVFPLTAAEIRCRPFEIPREWPQIGGMDFGFDHPFAAVRLAWDPESDCVYITQTHRVRQQIPSLHAAVLRKWGPGLIWAWPHDGLAAEKGSGRPLKVLYEEQGLNMLSAHATHEGGGFQFEIGLLTMLDRMRTGRFKVFDHLSDWFAEFEAYHRVKGAVVKKDDDLLSATRMAVMMLRHAEPLNAAEFVMPQTNAPANAGLLNY